MFDQGYNDYEANRERRFEFDSESDEREYHAGWMNAFDYGDRNRNSTARWAQSDIAPPDFDPMDAGERWNEDDPF